MPGARVGTGFAMPPAEGYAAKAFAIVIASFQLQHLLFRESGRDAISSTPAPQGCPERQCRKRRTSLAASTGDMPAPALLVTADFLHATILPYKPPAVNA